MVDKTSSPPRYKLLINISLLAGRCCQKRGIDRRREKYGEGEERVACIKQRRWEGKGEAIATMTTGKEGFCQGRRGRPEPAVPGELSHVMCPHSTCRLVSGHTYTAGHSHTG